MKLNTEAEVLSAERVLRLVWVIVAGAVLFSVLTVTPLVQRVTPAGWELTAPILPLVVDAAVVIVVRVGAITARLGARSGIWPALLRVLTGVMTLALNVGDSALAGDLVGVGVHAVAPGLLIVTAEAELKWRRAITEAVDRIERERREADERERERREAERERERQQREAERERQEAAERERRREEREEREAEREHAAQLAREEREHAARLAREERERQERERQEAAERERRKAEREERERQERERREAERAQREKAERERRERERREAAERERQERERQEAERRKSVSAPVSAAVSAPRPSVSAAVSGSKMPVSEARAAVAEAVREGRPQREAVALTGWSAGWVAARYKELAHA